MNYAIDDLLKRYPILESCKDSILKSLEIMIDCFKNGHKLVIAGNGGSCADADHIVGELMKGFKYKRQIPEDLSNKLFEVDKKIGSELSSSLQQCLPAIALHNNQALNTAFLNDIFDSGEFLFAQQLFGYGRKGDVFLAISSSGDSKNIINAAVVAKAKGMKIVALTGRGGGTIKKYADISIIVPLEETFMIQELHLPIYHWLCLMLEERFFCNS